MKNPVWSGVLAFQHDVPNRAEQVSVPNACLTGFQELRFGAADRHREVQGHALALLVEHRTVTVKSEGDTGVPYMLGHDLWHLTVEALDGDKSVAQAVGPLVRHP